MEEIKVKDVNRFWSNVNKTSDCWLWTNKLLPNGYGRLKINGRQYLAHRYSYLIHNKDLPLAESGLCVDHLCRNRACVNPKHLELVSIRENIIRGNIVKKKKVDLPVGVHKKINRYQVQKCFGKTYCHIGSFDNIESASVAYQTAIIGG